MKKIIVPIDFSECSKNALGSAISMAEKMHLELVVVHSMVAPVAYAEGTPITTIDMGLKSIEQTAQSELDDLLATFSRLDKITYHTELQYGSLSELLVTLTEEMEVAFVIMGTHGASGLKKTLLGSNTYHVMNKVKCPVIALPDKVNLARMKHLALALDCHDIPGHDVLITIQSLAKAFLCDLHLVHIDNKQVEGHRQLEVGRAMEKYLKAIPHQFHFLEDEDVEGRLTSFAKDHDINLLMLVTKHHGFIDRIRHGSLTKELVSDIQIPLLSFHD